MTNITKIFDATIRRSGASLTVRGRDGSGEPLRVTGVELVEMTDAGPLATKWDGSVYQLMAVRP